MNETLSPSIPDMLDAMRVDEVDPIVVGPGCLRRDLPGPDGLRVWMVDMAPGSVWPVVDEHDTGETVYVVAGEVIEDGQRFGMGTYLYFKPEAATGRAPRRAQDCSGSTRGEENDGALPVCRRVLGTEGPLPLSGSRRHTCSSGGRPRVVSKRGAVEHQR
ncbi:MAG TPA: hypothetical protein VFW60_10035 [Rhodanobacteraceae bacterium]|nr:hypothetical protein [Rhodanobacteraceae bacterium]